MDGERASESQSMGHLLSRVWAPAVRSTLLLFAVSSFTPLVCRHAALCRLQIVHNFESSDPTGSDHAIEILEADF